MKWQQSCGSGVLADGRLGDLIRRVVTFGMVLMKLDLRQVLFKNVSIDFLKETILTEIFNVSGIW